MTMNYEKITVPRFAERLKGNMYKNVTAARRAIGKADWSPNDRQKAHQITNKHFGADASPVPTKSTNPVKQASQRQGGKDDAKTGSETPGPLVGKRDFGSDTPTNAEIIDLCGVANELVETIRKSAEVSMDARPVLTKGTNLLYGCLEIVAHALQGNALPKGGLTSTAKVVEQLGKRVTPQSFIAARKRSAAAENEEEERTANKSAAGGR